MSKSFLRIALGFSFVITFASVGVSQIPNQLTQDFVAGSAPSPAEVAQFEKDAAANPNDHTVVRKLGKAYYFQFFDEGDQSAVPRSAKTFEKALAVKKNDPETLVYFGSLHILRGVRLEKNDAKKQKVSFDTGFEMIKLAESIDPRHGAVVSVASASYLWLPDSYGMAQHVVDILEGMRKGMGPMFKKFAHHGQQRILLTLGQAYIRTGKSEKALPLFEEALAVNTTSREAALLRAELKKLGK